MKSGWKWCLRVSLLVLCLLMAVPAAAEEKQLTGISMAIIRSSTGKNAGIIGLLPHGSKLTVLDSRDGYYRIDCYEMSGYIHGALVEQTGEDYIVNAMQAHPDIKICPALPEVKTALLRQKMVDTALLYRGVPYVWGGTTPRGFDCSGFTQYVYRKCGLVLPRSCSGQFGAGMIVAKEDLQPGDLILFQNTGSARGLSHVGMYIGGGKLIHAGSKGITVVELANGYFTKHYMCARRIVMELPEEETPEDAMAAIPFEE